MKQDILNLENKVVGSIELDQSIFGLEVCADILHRVVVWQLARLQCGNHKTKGRSWFGSWPDCRPVPTKPKAVRKLP